MPWQNDFSISHDTHIYVHSLKYNSREPPKAKQVIIMRVPIILWRLKKQKYIFIIIVGGVPILTHPISDNSIHSYINRPYLSTEQSFSTEQIEHYRK